MPSSGPLRGLLLLLVLAAVLFAFNNGRSRTTWQGFSFRWFTGSTGSVFHDPALQSALEHTLLLAGICVGLATPIGVALALGLQRWRGRGSGTVNTLMLLPLVTPEIPPEDLRVATRKGIVRATGRPRGHHHAVGRRRLDELQRNDEADDDQQHQGPRGEQRIAEGRDAHPQELSPRAHWRWPRSA